MKPSDFKIGQQLWFVCGKSYTNRGEGCTHIVKAIGRKWVTAGPAGNSDWLNQRFEPAEKYMPADGKGYSSPGRYYISEQAHKEETERDRIVEEIRRSIGGYGPRLDITLSMASRIKAILDEVKP